MKKLILIIFLLISTLVSAQTVNFTGAAKRDTKNTLKDYGFDLSTKTKIFSRISVITAYNESASIFSFYVFISGKCTESHITFIGQNEDFWLNMLDTLEQFNETTWLDPASRQVYSLYFNQSLGQWAVRITPY